MSNVDKIISMGAKSGLDISDIMEAIMDVMNTAVANYEDDGKLDAKELVLLARMVVSLSIGYIDDEHTKDILSTVSKLLKMASHFVPGSALEDPE